MKKVIEKTYNFFKSPKGIVVSFFISPIIIILVFHGTNWLYDKYSWNLNPKGIDNAVWFGFLGSFLGGIGTLLAVVHTLKNNNDSLNRTILENQRQIVYQAKMANIQNEKKILSDAISNFAPYTIVNYFLEHQNLLNTSYDVNKASNIICDCNFYSMKIEADNLKIRIETDILDTCYNSCKQQKFCKHFLIKKEFEKTYTLFYQNTIEIANKIRHFIREIMDKVNESGYEFNENDKEIIIKTNDILTDLEKFRYEYTIILATLTQLTKNYIKYKENLEKERLNGKEHLYYTQKG